MISIKSFRRITSSSNFIPEIDGLRFIAIITVVFLHTNTNFKRVYADIIPEGYADSFANYIFARSGIGVDLFFSISGFILGLPFARQFLLGEKKVNIGNYFIRRLTRLEPPFVLALLVLFIPATIVNGVGKFEYVDNLFASLAYSHMFIYGEWSPINPVTWSLETEVQFYILAPIISYLLFLKNPKVRRWLLIGVILVLDVTIPYLLPNLQTIHMHKSIINYLHSFLVGYAFVDVFLFSLKNIRKSYWFDIIGITSIVVMYIFHPDIVKYERLFFDIAVFGLFTSVFFGKIINSILTLDFFTAVGGMCYTIYLLHYPVLFAAMKLLSKVTVGGFLATLVFNFVVSILLLLIVSAIFFKLIEQPCMDKNWPTKLKEYINQKLGRANARV